MRRCFRKKGSIQDLLFVAVVLLVFSVVIIVGYKINNELNIKFQATDKIDAEGKSAFDQINNLYPGVLDNSFLFLVVGLSIGALVLAAMVRIHPIFIAVFFIVLSIIVFLSAIFSNIYDKIATEPEMAALAANLTFTSQIMSTLPWIIAIFGSLLAIIMYRTYRMAEEF